MASKRTGKSRRKSGASKRGATGVPWWEEAEEVPRAGLEDAQTLSRRGKRLRRFVWASVVLFPITLIVLLLVLFSRTDTGYYADDSAAVTVQEAEFAATKSTALVHVKKWLAANPSPLPGGSVVAWDSANFEDVTGDNPYRVETHSLTLSAASGALFTTTIRIATSDSIGVVVVGEPSLIPHVPSAASFTTEAWTGFDTVTPSDPVEQAVNAWATAYSSGDPNSLRSIVRDQDAAHSYVPLLGASLTACTTRSGAGITSNGKPSDNAAVTPPALMLTRVECSITWAGVPSPDGASPAVVTYDLLVADANSAAPYVVAWGGTGTGPQLRKQSNAVTGRGIEMRQTDDASTVLGDTTTPPPANTKSTKKSKNKKAGR